MSAVKPRVDVVALATGRWPEILEAAGIDAGFLKDVHGPCPSCGGKDRFRFDDKNGKGTFFCSSCGGPNHDGGAGDGFGLLERVFGWDFKEAKRFILKDFFGETSGKTPLKIVKPAPVKVATKEEDLAQTKAYLLRTWKQTKLVTPGDPVWLYLTRTRKLPIKRVPRVIRYHPGMKYVDKETGKTIGTFPVMLTATQGPHGKTMGLHRTYLTLDGQKAPVPKPKKLMKSCGIQGGAIRLAKAGKKLALAEGIETAFAVMAITGMPCWATLNATLMPSVVIPPEVEEIYVFADNDLPDEKGRRAGQEKSQELVERLRSEGRKVHLVLPHQPGTDFHDVYLERLAKEEQKAQKRAAKRAARKVA